MRIEHASTRPFPYTDSDIYALPLKTSDPAAYQQQLTAISASPVEVIVLSGGAGLLPFDWGPRGSAVGLVDPIHGAGNGAAMPDPNASPPVWFARLAPSDIHRRMADSRDFIRNLKSVAKVGKVFTYIDFGTQLFGNHLMPPDFSPDLWGFWEFYEHWEEYAQAFGLGPRPESPTAWLRTYFDPDDATRFPENPELRPFSFGYSPIRSSVVGYPYRYAVCINTPGWSAWWRQVVRFIAMTGFDGIFLDNSDFGGCWNAQCQQGFRAHIAKKFAGGASNSIVPGTDAYRYFVRTSTKNIIPYAGFDSWYQLSGSTQWLVYPWAPADLTNPSAVVPIFPDLDAVQGTFSCRMSPPAPDFHAIEIATSIALTAGANYVFSASVKATGTATATIVVAGASIAVDASTIGWHVVTATLQVATSGSYTISIQVSGDGSFWIDDERVSLVSDAPTLASFVGLLEQLGSVTDPMQKLLGLETAAYYHASSEQRMRQLLSEAHRVNPAFKLFTNGFHSSVAHLSMAEKGFVPEMDLARQEAGMTDVGYFPGIYDDPADPGFVANIFGYKYLHAKVTRHPMVSQITPRPAAGGLPGHNPDSVLLQLAEATAFGGGVGVDDLLLEEYSLYTDAQAAAIRATEASFWAFAGAHQHVFTGLVPHGDIGVFFDLDSLAYYGDNAYGRGSYNQIFDLAHGLADQGVLHDVLTPNRTGPKALARLRALIVHDMDRLTDEMVAWVAGFLASGGIVFASGYCGDYDDVYRPRYGLPLGQWPPTGRPPAGVGLQREHQPDFTAVVGAGLLVYQQQPLDPTTLVDQLEQRLNRPVRAIVTGVAGAELRVNAWVGRATHPVRMTVHLVNYAVPLGQTRSGPAAPLPAIDVTVAAPPGFTPTSVTFHSPEFASSTSPISVGPNGMITIHFPAGAFRIYAIAEIKI